MIEETEWFLLILVGWFFGTFYSTFGDGWISFLIIGIILLIGSIFLEAKR